MGPGKMPCELFLPRDLTFFLALETFFQLLAGMDVDNAESMNSRMQFNITGFPTLIYFK